MAGAAGKGISRGSMTAREIIAAEKKAGVDKKFPGELLNNTLDEITKMSRREGKLKGIAQTAYKLLTNHKFDKGDNGKRGKL